MGYYVIGIGGTGAKCVESFIHLCAAGLMPDNKPLMCLFVDPDGANGSLKRTSMLLKSYDRCQQMQRGESDLFKTALRMTKPEVWSPFRERPPRLDQFFSSNAMANTPGAHLFDALYTKSEQSTSLDMGFRGHPSIGAAVMAATVKLGGDEPWDAFFEKLKQDVKSGEQPKVVLLGSIFGGTGASGVPTISRLISDEFKKQIKEGRLGLASVLMLPYFSFDPVKAERLRVDADQFPLSTQTALEYYFRQDQLKICNAVYLLGEETLTPMRNSALGGEGQENEPHLLEIYAALAAIHFFENEEVNGYPQIARATKARTSWSDLPHGKGFAELKARLEQLTRFAFAYVSSYHPMLVDIHRNGRGYRAPWFVNLLKRHGVDLGKLVENELLHVKTYCDSFLLWLANIEQSKAAATGTTAGLVNFNAFADRVTDDNGKQVTTLKAPQKFTREAFGNLLLPEKKTSPRDLTDLWARMSEARVKDASADGAGRFVRALYDACGAGINRVEADA